MPRGASRGRGGRRGNASKRGRGRSQKYSVNVHRNRGIISYLPLMRTTLTCLPLGTFNTAFDLVFNLVSQALGKVNYYTGAYGMFGVSAGAFLVNSPLLAKDSAGKFSFPGYPVKVKYLNFKLRDTTQAQERSGRWAAVFIPYREEHDRSHYSKILSALSYSEVAAMPYAVSGSCLNPLRISFRMRDPSDFCARPRELSEKVGVVMVIWDTGSRSDFKSKPDNISFNCEIEVSGGCVPHILFRPTHRALYDANVFKIRQITTGTVTSACLCCII